ncbi:MAG: Gfo/Idh/MocA family oxidoreductase [Anaerolineae bacterium]|nr:Gfo/Idh/MocA family oxidoreductase [Thermoflexales bacterium]MDW8406199.1 Gfo/Idh/MocA family oxidoreductase [Anaerolineae bacterium]
MSDLIRIGMIGLDTSHCAAFAGILHDSEQPWHVAGGQIVAAVPGGSEAFSLSRNRVAGFTAELRAQYGVRLVDDIETLVVQVDAILLESVDGRQHLEQFRRAAVGKPVFIDKPFATTTAEAREIIRIAEHTGTPLMSCSSLRYAAGIDNLISDPAEKVQSCEAFGPMPILEDYPGLFWYGIHSAEMLFAFMGTGCARVRRMSTRDIEIVIGEWRDGQAGVMRGTRLEQNDFGCVVHTNAGTRLALAAQTPPHYYTLLTQVMAFFRSGISPVPIEETFEIVSFLEAAERSQLEAGLAVNIG